MSSPTSRARPTSSAEDDAQQGMPSMMISGPSTTQSSAITPSQSGSSATEVDVGSSSSQSSAVSRPSQSISAATSPNEGSESSQSIEALTPSPSSSVGVARPGSVVRFQNEAHQPSVDQLTPSKRWLMPVEMLM